MNTDKLQSSNQNDEQDKIKNGVVTVNDENNPTPDERDELIGKENDTDRLRSERESVQEANRNNNNNS